MTIDKKLQRLADRQDPERLTERYKDVSTALKAGRETGFGGGVLILCEPTGRFLFIKRSSTGDQPGTWCCPGGGIEDNETIEQGVHRECREEIGYYKPMDLIHMHRDAQPGFVFHNHFAVVPAEFEPKLNEEHTDYQWAEEPPSPVHPRLENSVNNWMTLNATN